MVDFKWFRNFRERFANRGADGFSLIEMVTIIPVVALSGGFIIILISQGITASAESNAISNASVAVNARVNEVQTAVNCYDLKQMVSKPKIYEQPSGVKDISVNHAIVGTCESGKNVEVTLAGREVGNSRVLYRENVQFFISE